MQGSNSGLLCCRQEAPALQMDSLLTEPPGKPLYQRGSKMQRNEADFSKSHSPFVIELGFESR